MLVLNKSSLGLGTEKLFPGVSVVGLVTRGRGGSKGGRELQLSKELGDKEQRSCSFIAEWW